MPSARSSLVDYSIRTITDDLNQFMPLVFKDFDNKLMKETTNRLRLDQAVANALLKQGNITSLQERKLTTLTKELKTLIARIKRTGSLGAAADDDWRLDFFKSREIAKLAKRSLEVAKNEKELQEVQNVLRKSVGLFLSAQQKFSRSGDEDPENVAKMQDLQAMIKSIGHNLLRRSISPVGLGEKGVSAKREPRAVIATVAVEGAARYIRGLLPDLKTLHLVGSRLRHKYGRDIDFVGVSDMTMNRKNLLDLKFRDHKINLFIVRPEEVESAIIEYGLGMDITRWKKAAIARGYKLNRSGLWKRGVRVTNKMSQIAKLIGMTLKPHLVWSLKNPF